ncbi:hypothetical protein N7490_008541 [Penicillium lividum]|nr:hypothetical protein N7490_008541 [Penicillium lividum]
MVDHHHHHRVDLMGMRGLAIHRKVTANSMREWSMWNDVLERIHPEIAQDPEVEAMKNILTDADTITITTMSILVWFRVQIRYIGESINTTTP